MFILLAFLPQLSSPSVEKSAVAQTTKDAPRSSVNGPVEPVELLRQALANFKVRGARARDYVYVEHYKNKDVDVTVSNNFEIMSIDGQPYRRHIGLNGLPLSPIEEKEDEERIKALTRQMLENESKIRRSLCDGAVPTTKEKTAHDPPTDVQVATMVRMYERFKSELASDAEEMRNGGSLLIILGDDTIDHLRFPLERVLYGFDLHFKGGELLERRNTYIIEARPRGEPKTPSSDELEASNFKMKIWIDELDEEIVKLEGKAIHSGLISRSDKNAIESIHAPPECEAKLLKLLPESTLSYDAGSLIRMQWRKINGEAWLPAEIHFKTTQIYTSPVCVGKDVKLESSEFPWEYKIEFSDYKKFHVDVRILPPH